jgi:hypothetical protein
MREKNFYVVFSFIAATLALSCSGGGGGGGGEDPQYYFEYTGPTVPPAITAQNAGPLVEAVFFGPEISPDSLPTGTGRFGKFWRQAREPDGRWAGRSSQLSNADNYEEPGACGGKVKVSMSLDLESGRFSGSSNFLEYNDCTTITNGYEHLRGRIEMAEFTIVEQTVHMHELTETGAEGSFTMTGTLYTSVAQPGTIVLNMRVRDDATGKVSGYENFTYYQGWVDTYQVETLTGSFFDPDYGLVQVATPEPLGYYYSQEWPDRGFMEITGASDTKARLVPLTPVLYRVDGDTGGDGSFDFSSPQKHWPGANSAPSSSLNYPGGGNVGCPIPLKDTGSSDFDGDPLTFQWVVTSRPAGSAAAPDDPTAKETFLVPDLPGEYTVALHVYDGYGEAYPNSATINVYAGNLFCSGSESSYMEIWLEDGVFVADMAVGDVSGDGRDDLCYVTATSGTVPAKGGKLYVAVQNPDGTLAPSVIYDTSSTEYWESPAGVAIGDINNDAKNEVTVTVNDRGLDIFTQAPGGTLELTGFVAADAVSIIAGDLNGDSLTDLAGIGGQISLWLQDSSGGLQDPALYSFQTVSRRGFTIGDISGDGRSDMILSGWSPGLEVFLQSDTGTFGSPAVYEMTVDGGGLSVGDFNGDSLGDVAVSCQARTGVFLQNSSGLLDAPVYYEGNVGSMRIAKGDFNGDGRSDLAGVYGKLWVLPQNPDGTMGDYLYHWSDRDATAAVTGDLNGDGKTDIATMHSQLVMVFYNVGP